MPKTIDQAIAELTKEVDADEAKLRTKKVTINTLCVVNNIPPRYSSVEMEVEAASEGFGSDEFYGHPLATSVQKILESRKTAGAGPANLDEIYEALLAGSFLFDAKSDSTAKRSLSIALAKNTQKFHKLPNGQFGLRAWYPKIPKKSVVGGDGGSPERYDERSQGQEEEKIAAEVSGAEGPVEKPEDEEGTAIDQPPESESQETGREAIFD